MDLTNLLRVLGDHLPFLLQDLEQVVKVNCLKMHMLIAQDVPEMLSWIEIK